MTHTAATERPPVPVTCARRPLTGGLVVPVVNVRLADGGDDHRQRHTATYERCWKEGLCQVCGGGVTHPAVVIGGPSQLRSGHFDEAPLCAPCALYVTRACPMVAGGLERFASGPSVSQGQRGAKCAEPGCDCGGWVKTDPAEAAHHGRPAHGWYAAWTAPGAWTLTAERVVTVCADKGCEHKRLVLNGALLTSLPLKVVCVSEPGQGRVWRRLSDSEVTRACAGWAAYRAQGTPA